MTTPKTITHVGLRPRRAAAAPYGSYHAEVVPGVSIRIHGTDGHNAAHQFAFDRTFKVGDVVEYDSYNMSYTGPILAIGPSTVTVKTMHRKNARMSLYDFCSRNCRLDLDKIAARNAAWTD